MTTLSFFRFSLFFSFFFLSRKLFCCVRSDDSTVKKHNAYAKKKDEAMCVCVGVLYVFEVRGVVCTVLCASARAPSTCGSQGKEELA